MPEKRQLHLRNFLHQQMREVMTSFARDANPDVNAVGDAYRLFLKQLTCELSACASALVFIDPSDLSFDRIFATGYGDNFNWWDNVSSGEGLISRVIKNNKSEYVDDVTNESTYKQLCSNTRSQITLLVTSGLGDCLGAIGIEFADQLSRESQDLIFGASASISFALRSIDDYIFSRRADYVFSAVAEIDTVANDDKALEIVVQAANLLVGEGEVAVLRRSGGALSVRKYSNIDQADIPRDLRIGISTGRGYTCFVAHTRKAYYCRNTRDLASNPYYRAVVHSTLSQYTAPLLFRNELVGVLNVGARTPYAFATRDRRLIDMLAQHAAQSLFYRDMLKGGCA